MSTEAVLPGFTRPTAETEKKLIAMTGGMFDSVNGVSLKCFDMQAVQTVDSKLLAGLSDLKTLFKEYVKDEDAIRMLDNRITQLRVCQLSTMFHDTTSSSVIDDLGSQVAVLSAKLADVTDRLTNKVKHANELLLKTALQDKQLAQIADFHDKRLVIYEKNHDRTLAEASSVQKTLLGELNQAKENLARSKKSVADLKKNRNVDKARHQETLAEVVVLQNRIEDLESKPTAVLDDSALREEHEKAIASLVLSHRDELVASKSRFTASITKKLSEEHKEELARVLLARDTKHKTELDIALNERDAKHLGESARVSLERRDELQAVHDRHNTKHREFCLKTKTRCSKLQSLLSKSKHAVNCLEKYKLSRFASLYLLEAPDTDWKTSVLMCEWLPLFSKLGMVHEPVIFVAFTGMFYNLLEFVIMFSGGGTPYKLIQHLTSAPYCCTVRLDGPSADSNPMHAAFTIAFNEARKLDDIEKWFTCMSHNKTFGLLGTVDGITLI